MKKILGITGFAQSGKDTIGRILVEDYGFYRIGFADAVRDAVLALDPYVTTGSLGFRISQLVQEIGWERAKTEYPEVRRLLQRMGTEVGRDLFGDRSWIDIGMRKAEGHDKVVFTDVRFANEAVTIQEAGGEIWKVQRPGVKPAGDHASEKLDFRVDWLIVNDSSVEVLKGAVRDLLR
ncbi:MAG: hypothetical protein E6Q97_34355 [Desulfurellales bacterium]|nr:MAG: hypothetical protein E6Q97_34355 [Desulfurellales bacterium]